MNEQESELNSKTQESFQRNDAEFLKLTNLAINSSVEQLKKLKLECIKHAEAIFNKKNATVEENAHANMLLNFAECELSGIEL
jgi:hypothetical protein